MATSVFFFDTNASKDTKLNFEEYVKTHLRRRAVEESVSFRRIYICDECATPLTELQVRRRRERGYDWILCNVCNARISLQEYDINPDQSSSDVLKMDNCANLQSDREVARSVIQGKNEVGDFDVFICYNSNDRDEATKLGNQLKELGILPWLDEWQLRPGFPWQEILEQQIGQIKSAIVLVGADGMGPWQKQELNAFLREFVDRGCPVIPVLLKNTSIKPALPIFLRGMSWVDFSREEPNPMQRLIFGITGKRLAD